jgi:hypothetical protein
MKTEVLVRQDINIEGEVRIYSQLPNAKNRKDQHYKVSVGSKIWKRGIYFSNGSWWCPCPDMYFNDELKEMEEEKKKEIKT